jgi:hypothetical protein
MTHTTRKLLKWELRWIPIEMAMVGFGLYLQLGLHLDEAGAFFLFLAVAMSGAVRFTHYWGGGRQQEKSVA